MTKVSVMRGFLIVKILVDTNIILDVLCNRAEFADASEKIFKLCEINKIEGYVSALSFPNIVYIMRKELTNEKIKEIINGLFLIFSVIDLNSSDIKKAASSDFSDFEDALQSIAAIKVNAKYIVTRNINNFSNSNVPGGLNYTVSTFVGVIGMMSTVCKNTVTKTSVCVKHIHRFFRMREHIQYKSVCGNILTLVCLSKIFVVMPPTKDGRKD